MTNRSTLLLLTALGAAATPAHAHVFVQSGPATVGGSYRAVLAVPHGCGTSPTTKITVQIPEGMIAVKPMAKPGWTIAVKKGAYAQSYDFMHGLKASEGVKEITWTGKLDNDFYDEFVFSAYLPAALKADAPLYLPTLQSCEQGSEEWAQIPVAGQDPHSLKSPAPIVRLAAAAPDNAMAQMSGMVHAGDLMISTPWTRATPPGAKVAGGYLTVTNGGKTSDKLLGGTFTGGSRIEVHEMSMNDGVMKMRPLNDGLEIKPGATVKLEPGGYHLMLMDLAKPLAKGDKVKAQLQFEKAGKVDVELDVNAVGASAPAGGGHAH
ncbi:DUF1775 domain-containing protein [Tardiphaga sp. P9-11]|jgi:uncharacterized protein YcnI/copper(I)-binding protein|uniref:DUF1775 domain-containing protein n=1 Tax=Tardiphaga sp. P9-11 TaxID=2024614 RepID=UPI0011F1107E|nr:DUF1775 domain-containing protein [Tardiphaga sp. P9-11]KAA0072852.1 DUF1775 domain-containing protein [Tardiphaga sp. P9-11]